MPRVAKIAAVILGAAVAWLYLPPVGTKVELPDLEPLLEPPVSHGKPVFIMTADHVYYRVRLNEPVAPTFGSDYFEELLRRGIQFKEVTTSPHRLIQRRTGWTVAMAREKEKEPYTIEYWTARDSKTPWRPVQLRWPWLYVRLGRGILESKTAVLLPEKDTVSVNPSVPRYPGSILRNAFRTREFVQLRFVARARRHEILRYYAEHFKAQSADSLYVSFSLPEEIAVSLSRPDNVHIEVQPYVYGDEPLVVYSAEVAASLESNMYPRQPASLAGLPDATLYALHLRYPSEAEAKHIFPSLQSP